MSRPPCIIHQIQVNCCGRTVLYMCIEYPFKVNMYHVSAQGVDERMINVHLLLLLRHVLKVINQHLESSSLPPLTPSRPFEPHPQGGMRGRGVGGWGEWGEGQDRVSPGRPRGGTPKTRRAWLSRQIKHVGWWRRSPRVVLSSWDGRIDPLSRRTACCLDTRVCAFLQPSTSAAQA